MTLDSIYRDVNSKLSVQHEYEEKFYSLDTIKAINDAISAVRLEAAQNRVAEQIAVTQVINNFTLSANHPYLVEATLSASIINTVDPMSAILQADYWVTANTLDSGFTSATVGDRRNIGRKLYQCVETYAGVNAQTRIFDGNKLRYFAPNDNATYLVGDIIHNGGSYWKVLENFANTTTQTFEEGARFEKQFWVFVGNAFGPTSVYTFERISQMKLLSEDDCTGTRGVAVKKDKVYCSPNVPKLTITYVPEWTFINNLDTNLDIPSEWLPEIKQRAVQTMLMKIQPAN
jgi:hypothetical protein